MVSHGRQKDSLQPAAEATSRPVKNWHSRKSRPSSGQNCCKRTISPRKVGTHEASASTVNQQAAHSVPRSHQYSKPSRSQWVWPDTSRHTEYLHIAASLVGPPRAWRQTEHVAMLAFPRLSNHNTVPGSLGDKTSQDSAGGLCVPCQPLPACSTRDSLGLETSRRLSTARTRLCRTSGRVWRRFPILSKIHHSLFQMSLRRGKVESCVHHV